MGYAERLNPRSLRNLNPDERAVALQAKEARKEECTRTKVYVKTMNYLQGLAILRFLRKKQEQREAAKKETP
jgi:arginine utilization protein RocB